MLKLIIKKLLRTAFLLTGILLITFLLVHAIPGNPWSNYSSATRMLQNISSDPVQQKELSLRFGLNLPIWRQFTRFLIGDFNPEGTFFCGALCGNLGPSIQQQGRTVQSIIFDAPENKTFKESRFGYSIRLFSLGALLAIGAGLALGMYLSASPHSPLSDFINFGLSALISIPNFVLGLLTIIVLASWLRIMKVLPDWNQPTSWIIPALVLAIIPMAGLARVTRSSLMNLMHEDYIRTARAKGLSLRRVILTHLLRSALAPILSSLGPALMELFTGLLVIETLYGFPGMARDYWGAVLDLDYPMILGLTLIYAIGMLLINLLIELVSEALDPRLRSKHSTG
ncbi:MAG: ABC transporter permease [Chloroflexota bacterium]